MALINKIRERSGLAIGIITIGLIMFLVGGDLLGPNSQILGGNANAIGEIDGKEIDVREFAQKVEAYKTEYQFVYNYKFNESEMGYVRNQAWNRLLEDYAFQKQYEALGLTVTDEELKDMVQGNNITEDIANSFKNPETGEVDRNAIIRFLQNFNQLPQEQQIAFSVLESRLRPKRLREKYDNMFALTTFTTDAEAQARYQEQNTTLEVEYLYVPYTSISDSAIDVSASAVDAYFSKNKNEYKQEASTTVKYIAIPMLPSAQDTLDLKKELEDLKKTFAETDNDTIFASAHSELKKVLFKYNLGELPPAVADADRTPGTIVGPVTEGDMLKIYKIRGIAEDTVYSMRASHILFRAGEKDPEDKRQVARKKALEVLQELKNGADFAAMARQHGTDGTKEQGGDLGWFTEGRMVAPFEKAVMVQNSAGLVPNLVETQFGYHIIKVTEPKVKEKLDVVSIAKRVTASEATINEHYRIASQFQMVDDAAAFEKLAAETPNVNVKNAPNIRSNSQQISGLNEKGVRPLVMWTFKEDTEVGSISEVFETENHYVVALLDKRFEDGVPSLEQVQEKVLADARNAEKAKQIIEKLNGTSGTLQERKDAYGNDARIISMGDLRYSSLSLTGVGFAPKTIGAAFAVKEGELIGPMEEDYGVVILKVKKRNDAAEVADYSKYAKELQDERTRAMGVKVTDAIEELTDSKEHIARFY